MKTQKGVSWTGVEGIALEASGAAARRAEAGKQQARKRKEQEEKKRMVMTKQRADEVEQRREAVRKPLLLDGELVNAGQRAKRGEVWCKASTWLAATE